MNSKKLLSKIQIEAASYLLMTLLMSIWCPWGVFLVAGLGCIDLSLSLGYYGWRKSKENKLDKSAE
jgi:hypothetical protein